MRISACLVVLGVIAAITAPARAQSLADVVKKQEEQRKAGSPAAPKVYTNTDLRPLPAVVDAPASSVAPTATDSADLPVDGVKKGEGDAPSPAASTASETKDRAYWAKKMAAAREELDRNRVLLESVQSRVNVLMMDFVNRDDPAQRGKIANDRDRAMLELDRLKKAVAAGEKAIPTIEEEARQAGAPAGWLR